MTNLKAFRKAIDDSMESNPNSLFNGYSDTVCYDSSLVTCLIYQLLNYNYNSLPYNQWFTGSDNEHRSLFSNLLNMNNNFTFPSLEDRYDFVVCGDFGADHDDLEALIMICNVCRMCPKKFRLVAVTSSNVVNENDCPINTECVDIAKCIVRSILGPGYYVHYLADDGRIGTGTDLNKKVYSEKLYSLQHLPKDSTIIPELTQTDLETFSNNLPKDDTILCVIAIASMKIPFEIISRQCDNRRILLAAMGLYMMNPGIIPNSMCDNYRFDKQSSDDLIDLLKSENIKSICIGKGMVFDRSTILNKNHVCYNHFQHTHKLAILNVVKHWISEENFDTPVNKFPLMKKLKIAAFVPLLEHLNGKSVEEVHEYFTK